MRTRKTVIRLLIIAGVVFILYLYKKLPFFDQFQGKKIEWISPYKDINWETVIQAKAQFHTHTTLSDGELSPAELIDIYHEAGFDVLAITDHWKATWPWEDFNRSAKDMGMLAIQGAEPSYGGKGQHHIVSLFSNITGFESDFHQTLTLIDMVQGLASFAHPARITERNNNELADYIYCFDNFRQIYGIDIFTRATFREPERWPIGKQLYADLLMHYGTPSSDGWRPIWMTSTDDLHSPDQINQGFQIQLVDTLNQNYIYNSLKNGTFFWVANAVGEQPPLIESIDFKENTISVKGNGFDHISWYFNNEVIHTGEKFNAVKNASDEVFYVYFTAFTSDFSVEEKTGSLIGSQPFYIVRD